MPTLTDEQIIAFMKALRKNRGMPMIEKITYAIIAALLLGIAALAGHMIFGG